MSEHNVYLGLGGNLSNPVEQLKVALKSINSLPNTELLKTSSFYASKPQGPQDQPDFVNTVCQISTSLEPGALLAALQRIELEQGKVKKRHWGERLIDLDILLYDQLQMATQQLTLPHAHMHQRDFVLVPLAEIAPELEIPDQGSVVQLIEQLDESFLIPLDES